MASNLFCVNAMRSFNLWICCNELLQLQLLSSILSRCRAGICLCIFLVQSAMNFLRFHRCTMDLSSRGSSIIEVDWQRAKLNPTG